MRAMVLHAPGEPLRAEERWTDGTCRYCASGRENLSDAARFIGYGYGDLEAAPLLCAGIHMRDIPSFPYELLRGERRDGEEFLALAPQVAVRVEVETFPLEQANEALARLRAGAIRGSAVLRVGRA